jgi:hypothetical protein
MVNLARRYLPAVMAVILTACAITAQENPEGNQERPFFSGVVTELASGKVTVARTILGKPGDKRTFAITTETRIEGSLKVKSRVTVQFAPGDDGEVAVSIVVRDKDKKK